MRKLVLFFFLMGFLACGDAKKSVKDKQSLAVILDKQGEVIVRKSGVTPYAAKPKQVLSNQSVILTSIQSYAVVAILNFGSVFLYPESALEIKYLDNAVLGGVSLLKGKMEVHIDGKKKTQILLPSGFLHSSKSFAAFIAVYNEDKAEVRLLDGSLKARAYYKSKAKRLYAPTMFEVLSTKVKKKKLKKKLIWQMIPILTVHHNSRPEENWLTSLKRQRQSLLKVKAVWIRNRKEKKKLLAKEKAKSRDNLFAYYQEKKNSIFGKLVFKKNWRFINTRGEFPINPKKLKYIIQIK